MWYDDRQEVPDEYLKEGYSFLTQGDSWKSFKKLDYSHTNEFGTSKFMLDGAWYHSNGVYGVQEKHENYNYHLVYPYKIKSPQGEEFIVCGPVNNTNKNSSENNSIWEL